MNIHFRKWDRQQVLNALKIARTQFRARGRRRWILAARLLVGRAENEVHMDSGDRKDLEIISGTIFHYCDV
jgi:hypothetical protein